MTAAHQDLLLPDIGVSSMGRIPYSDNKPLLAAANPATVPLRSPFRYPGGKTWLVPLARQWLSSNRGIMEVLFEPFAGGAIIGLTAAFEKLAPKVTLVEIDPDVAAVWETILQGDGKQLAGTYSLFSPTTESVRTVLGSEPRSTAERAFYTLLRNRISRGGIIAPGAGILKNGENGKGLTSRWYPETIGRRIRDIHRIRDRIDFMRADGLSVMETHAKNRAAAWFIDPPYTVAGRRLYAYSEIDHERLFDITAGLAGDFVMTYDECDQVKDLADKHGFEIRRIAMKTSHHNQKFELLIGRSLSWLD